MSYSYKPFQNLSSRISLPKNVIWFSHLKSNSNNSSSFNTFKKSTILISSALLIAYGTNEYMSSYPSHVMASSNFIHSQIYSWGFNRYGQLGIGSENDESLPTLIEGLIDKQIKYISCGSDQTACITQSGELYTFGRGQDKRLGHGESSGVNETYPRLVQELKDKKVVYVDAGYLHMACVTEDGELWTWGKNSYNQLGHRGGDYPQPVEKLKKLGIKAKQVACGRYHTVVLDENGKVWSWGGWKSGETGTGTKKNTSEPTQISSLNDKTIVQISTGHDFTLFLASDGLVYACGASDYGQTGHGATGDRCTIIPKRVNGISNIKKIACGQFHSLAFSNDGILYTWGLNREGQLGHGDTQNRTTPSQLVKLYDHKLKIIDIAAGGGHSACIVYNNDTKSKQLYIFGRGRQGQIGRANNVESVAAYRPEPVEVDFFSNLHKKNNQELYQVSLGGNHSSALIV